MAIIKHFKTLVSVLSLVLAFDLQAAPLSPLQTEALTQLDWFHDLISETYEAKEIKSALFGWDLQTETALAQQRIARNSSDDKQVYQRIFRDYFKSARDYHVRVLSSSKATSTLPFRIRKAEGRYFISEIDAQFTDLQGLAVGDEVIGFDDLDMPAAIARTKIEMRTMSHVPTDDALASIKLTSASAANLDVLRQGPVEIRIIPKGEVSTQTLSFNWNYQVLAQPSIRHDTFFETHNSDFAGLDPATGAKNGPLPNFGKVLWQNKADGSFRAYIFELGQKKIGVIRIATFNGNQDFVDEFATLVAAMERETDALVLDQTNNPGGQIFYTYALVTYLIQTPVATPLFRQSVYKSVVDFNQRQLEAINRSTTLDELKQNLSSFKFYGFPITWSLAQDLKEYNENYLRAFASGQKILEPQFRRIRTLYPAPHAVTYTKPVLMLIDQLDMSCADMLPAFLQDLGRVKLFGEQTSGAGGNNDTGVVPSNSFGLATWSLTTTTMLRKDGSYLENNGAKPDYPYSLTVFDLQNNYSGYVGAVHAALIDMLK
ncbi:MAG: protease-like activity factor CPAF [Bdellovibrio sp.]|jgi:C-terminal processing protease CtpA/Prc